MKAAVVSRFDEPPSYHDVPVPVPQKSSEMVVDVVATALHPRVRSQADGSHYTSTGVLPLVPGIDAVVRDFRGVLYYALLDDTAMGTMAQRTVVAKDRVVALPNTADPVAVAAALNPAMSSWVALRHRINFERGSRVLILGATGSAGRMAIQVAKRFGADQVIAVGRSPQRLSALTALGADRVLTFDQLDTAGDVDVVIDYVWGPPTAKGMVDLLSHRRDRGKDVIWIEIGSMAGPGAEILSAALRSTRLQIVGSGIGSVSGDTFREEIPSIAEAVTAGAFDVRTRTAPLSDVTAVWTQSLGEDERVVFLP
ncbi:quinone oxidoreductase family protein [Mycobacterium terramassiliense]|uniref:NADPH:quinone reductase or related Zn-dependent oxidoreductase n=1 Tax=Mycobacterium terramassiliense TaxID=1841859 RepID=A0A2U3NJY3_9MYCO|nr:zinc-binding alcohol dehydrogenase family protein [Mycobacterium terramassiliense]SPM31796.1 NADPH:quinone reductase or related Zn-dependent oxidoreductase [Mycobacterium terramassiliense]